MRHDHTKGPYTQARESARRVRQGLAGLPHVPRVVPITHIVKLSHRIRKKGRVYGIFHSELVRR